MTVYWIYWIGVTREVKSGKHMYKIYRSIGCRREINSASEPVHICAKHKKFVCPTSEQIKLKLIRLVSVGVAGASPQTQHKKERFMTANIIIGCPALCFGWRKNCFFRERKIQRWRLSGRLLCCELLCSFIRLFLSQLLWLI